MTALDQTVLEMFTHLLQRHPHLSAKFQDAASKVYEDDFRDYQEWRNRYFTPPSPDFVKKICLIFNSAPKGTWVETGTYMGETTALLGRYGKMVYSIEPQPTLYENAKKRFESLDNIEIIHGISEEIFPSLLPKLEGDVNFWLDGHASGEDAFDGPQDTPIVDELKIISQNLHLYGKVSILIDDMRLFTGQVHKYGPYPTKDFLVDWARTHKFSWTIEHDIFIARNYTTLMKAG